MNSIFMKSGKSEISEIVKPLRLSGVQDCFGCFSPIFLNMIKKSAISLFLINHLVNYLVFSLKSLKNL